MTTQRSMDGGYAFPCGAWGREHAFIPCTMNIQDHQHYLPFPRGMSLIIVQ